MRTKWVVPIALLLPALFLLGQSLNYGFVSDDFHLLYRLDTEGFFSSWGGEQNDIFFRPLVVVTYKTDNCLWSLNPPGYHLTNIMWHLVCSFMVYLIAADMFKKKEQAFLSGYLFLLLACHSESVAWISGRTDLIATAFALVSILFFLRRSFFAIPVFAAALLAKESVIVIPLIWFLLEIYRNDWKNRRSIVLLISGVVILLFYISGRLLFSTGFSSELDSVGITLQSVSELFGNLARYSFRTFIPALPLAIRPLLLSYPVLVPLVLAGIGFVMWIPFRKKRAEGGKQIILFLGCFFLSLLPVILMKVSLFDSRSERFLYLPSVFAVLLLVKWVYSVIKSRRKAASLLILLAFFQGMFLYRSFDCWRIAGEMCREIVSSGSTDTPDNYRGAYVFRNGYDEALLLHERCSGN